MPYFKQQQGVALLMAMLVVSIATVSVVALVHDQAFSMRKSARMQLETASMMYSLALEDFAQILLREDLKNSKNDHLQEDWAVGIEPVPIDGGFLLGSLSDEQGKINLNNLVEDELSLKRFTLLCNNLELETDFIPALLDWIDSDIDVRYPDGAEDDYYTGLEVPYRTANQLLVDLSELQLIKGLDIEIIEKLKPYITVLPEKTSLNINTMSGEVYKTLGTNLDVDKFEKEREKDPFSSSNDMKQRLSIDIEEQGLSVKTNYFNAIGQVTLLDKTINFSTLIHRDDNGSTKILTRTFGDNY